MNNKFFTKKGFTLVELVISVAIFAFMTTFLLTKYGTMNQSILLTNLAYDVALTIREAQSYGINVKSAPTSGGANFSNQFSNPYGVHFSKSTGNDSNKEMIFFQDIAPSDKYYGPNEGIKTYKIKRGSFVSRIRAGSGPSSLNEENIVDITFKRPDPDAIIMAGTTVYPYVEIWLQAVDGGVKKVVVRSTGQITIID